jgi:hypothetical protein
MRELKKIKILDHVPVAGEVIGKLAIRDRYTNVNDVIIYSLEDYTEHFEEDDLFPGIFVEIEKKKVTRLKTNRDVELFVLGSPEEVMENFNYKETKDGYKSGYDKGFKDAILAKSRI